jgi:UrcA family protein
MKSLQRRSLTLLSVLISASVALSTTSVAGDATADRSRPAVHIRLADLDLTTSQGTTAAYKRIEFAAQSVCSSYDGAELPQRRIWRQCVSGSVESAVAQIGDSRLTAYYLSKTGRGAPQQTLASR